MTDSEEQPEDELGTFLATVTPADMSDWEWRLFNHYRLRGATSGR